MRIRRSLARLDTQKRNLQRPPPRREQRICDLIEDRRKQLREPGEGQRRLRFDPAARQHVGVTPACLVDAHLPEDRLADPCLAGEHERARALLDVGQKRLDRGELLLASDDCRRHQASTCSRLPGEPGPADAELAVDVREVGLDGAHAHEQLGGDLLVRAALGGELGDPAFGLGQLLRGGERPLIRSSSARAFSAQRARAELLEDR